MLSSSINNKIDKIDKILIPINLITIKNNITKSSSYDKNLENFFTTREYSLEGNNFNPNIISPNDSWKTRLEKRIKDSLMKNLY